MKIVVRRENVKPSQSKPIKWFHRQAFRQSFSLFFWIHIFALSSVWNVISTVESSKQICRFCAQPRLEKYFFKLELDVVGVFYEESMMRDAADENWETKSWYSTITGLLAVWLLSAGKDSRDKIMLRGLWLRLHVKLEPSIFNNSRRYSRVSRKLNNKNNNKENPNHFPPRFYCFPEFSQSDPRVHTKLYLFKTKENSNFRRIYTHN